MKAQKFEEAHVIGDQPGHIQSVDCWCEPTYYWMIGKSNTRIRVVEHDMTCIAREAIIAKRTASPDWVTLVLESVK